MTAEDSFESPEPGIDGIWPAAPATWSYSSLREAAECPRRWMLSRATYALVWGRPGYPQRPVLPALIGSVMHGALETILLALHARGSSSATDPLTVEVLKELGGFSAILQAGIDRELDRLKDNPRANHSMPQLASALAQRVPDMRQRVQTLIARANLSPEPQDRPVEPRGRVPSRHPLGEGTHPEVALHVDSLRFTGRADLLSILDGECTLTDYKTGARAEHHLDQLRIYALLWSQDAQLNPDGSLADRLEVAYATHDDVHEAPGRAELEQIEIQLTTSIAQAEEHLAERPPRAIPESAMCRLCGVRHLCDAYWPSDAGKANSPGGSEAGSFVDCEVSVVARNGPRSWVVVLEQGEDQGRGLLRTPSEVDTYRRGQRLRLLGVGYTRDDESDTAILTLAQSSEVFETRVL
ncbi:MAG: hypothetical protein QOJ29_86 [Thermoleophilaceae bacterium]|nr:hypothetical protein [Thermoleophilaceae bacterium]